MKKNKKILIIDDDRSILEALKICLKEYDYQVKVLDRLENISNILVNIPDIIIIDYLMSGTNGGNLVKKLKKNKKTKIIPIIMISAHPSAKKAAFDVGADEFISKPFDLDFVLEKINKNLNKSFQNLEK